MTDNEIIKALSCRSGATVDCSDCAYSIYKDCSVIIPQDALDLINRQKTEIEVLKEVNAKLKDDCRFVRILDAVVVFQLIAATVYLICNL